MPSQYIPILIVAMVAAVFPLAALAILRRARALSLPAQKPVRIHEISSPSADQALPEKNSEKVYVAGALFVICGSTLAFLVPWSVLFSRMGAYGLLDILTFLGVLLAGYAWLYQKGALDWK